MPNSDQTLHYFTVRSHPPLPSSFSSLSRTDSTGEDQDDYFQGDIRLMPFDDPYNLYRTVFKRMAFDREGSGMADVDLSSITSRLWPSGLIPFRFDQDICKPLTLSIIIICVCISLFITMLHLAESYYWLVMVYLYLHVHVPSIALGFLHGRWPKCYGCHLSVIIGLCSYWIVFCFLAAMEYRHYFSAAMHEWTRGTCLTFEQIGDYNISADQNYILFTNKHG